MTTTIKHVNSKLKALPDALIKDVEKYIDFLAYKHLQETALIPQWHKDLLDERLKDKKEPVDAFQMLDNIEKENEKI